MRSPTLLEASLVDISIGELVFSIALTDTLVEISRVDLSVREGVFSCYKSEDFT